MALRNFVWENTAADLNAMAIKLRNCLDRAQTQSPPGIDPLLGSCVLYNVGNTMPVADSAYWARGKAKNYERGLAKARGMLGL